MACQNGSDFQESASHLFPGLPTSDLSTSLALISSTVLSSVLHQPRHRTWHLLFARNHSRKAFMSIAVVTKVWAPKSIFFFFFFCFLGLHQRHMEVPMLGAESELQLLACITATATPDPIHICDLQPSSQQHWIPNQMSEARDQICILMDTSWAPYH